MADNSIGIKEIAEMAGVSQSTVSLVLNNKGADIRIAPATQEKIRRIAHEMNYQLPKRGKSGKKWPNKIIGIFWPADFEKGPLTSFTKGALQYIKEQMPDYEIFIAPYVSGELCKKKHLMCTNYFVGAVIMGLEDVDVDFLKEYHSTIPIVTFNREIKNYHSVKIDDYEIGQQAGRHLVKRGHKDIWVISPNYASKSLSLRTTGFFDELYAAGHSQQSSRPIIYGENSNQGGYEAAEEFLWKAQEATAVFVANDVMTAGFVYGLTQAGKCIPRDIEIITFGDHIREAQAGLSITSFALPIEQMAYDSIQILCCDMEDKISMNIGRNYTASCIFRESCPGAGVFRKETKAAIRQQ